jgi:hypothetical protein
MHLPSGFGQHVSTHRKPGGHLGDVVAQSAYWSQKAPAERSTQWHLGLGPSVG